MSESGEKLSLIDLIEYYEPGPVLRERTPDLNRTSFYPDEAQHFESDEAPEPGKNITRKAELDLIRKKALGLTDVPIHSTPGNSGAFRKRDEYNEEDFESQFTTGFGGPSELNNFLEIEDKPPTNITRKLKVKFNPDKKEELDKMSFQKSELLKLAKALRHRGQDSFAHRVEAVALRKVAQLGHQEMTKFEEYWDYYKVAARLGEAKGNSAEAFFKSTKPPGGNIRPMGTLTEAYVGSGTDNGLMLAACFYRPNQAAVTKLFKEHGEGWTTMEERSSMVPGMGKLYSEMTIMDIVKAEEDDEIFQKMCQAMLNGTVSSKNFDPIKGKFKAAPAGGGKAPSTGGGVTRDDRSTTQQRTWRDVQVKLNELYTEGGTLADKVKDGKIEGTIVEIPLDIDAHKWKDQTGLGEQTTGAFNLATGEKYEPNKWPVSPDQAYAKLEVVGKEEEDKDPKPEKGESKEGGPEKEESEEVAQSFASLSSGPVGYMSNAAFNAEFWTAPSPQHNGQIVGVGKAGGEYEGLIAVMVTKDVPSSITVNGEKFEPSDEAQFLVFPMKDRGELKGIEGSQALTGREKRKLLSVVRENDKDNLRAYRKILGGSTMAERGISEALRRGGRKRRQKGRDRLK